jgi:hypoxanthine phosphoribosyltransferase
MADVQLKDSIFELFITSSEIQNIVQKMAQQMEVLEKEKPLFLIVLSGSFLLASDLLQKLNFDAQVCFIKLKSYQGTQSTGEIQELIPIPKEIKNRNVVVIEDIIDTGKTIEYLYHRLQESGVKSIKIASLLLKPVVYNRKIKIDYIGKEIENIFVVGYGLDYDEHGRTLPDIYKLKKQ